MGFLQEGGQVGFSKAQVGSSKTQVGFSNADLTQMPCKSHRQQLQALHVSEGRQQASLHEWSLKQKPLWLQS